MAETAALLARHRLPEVLWRQWVLSFEGPMAMRLGYDRPLLGRVCQRFAKRVMQTLRDRTKCAHGLRSSAKLHPGVLIVVQRFRSDLGLFVHLHALVSDCCFEAPAMPNEAVLRAAAGARGTLRGRLAALFGLVSRRSGLRTCAWSS